MTVTLPRLTVLVQFVDPATGKPTRQGSSFWNSVAVEIEKNLQAIIDQEDALNVLGFDLSTRIDDIINGTTPFTGDPNAPGYQVAGIQVVGAQRPTIAALSGTATLGQVITAYNTLLASLKTHGLIAP